MYLHAHGLALVADRLWSQAAPRLGVLQRQARIHIFTRCLGSPNTGSKDLLLYVGANRLGGPV
jgi:hypothetical protein